MMWIDAILAALGSRKAFERLLARLYRELDPDYEKDE